MVEQFHDNSQHKIVKKISSSTVHDIIKRSDRLRNDCEQTSLSYP